MDLNVNKIIEDVKLHLTKDKQENLKYLNKMCQKYSTNPDAQAILFEFGHLIYQNTSQEFKNKFTQAALEKGPEAAQKLFDSLIEELNK